ncbi:MAG: histidinol dehydrogenase [Brumimicrobium sp.]|nr:histidinol dehydrogenase [Brumimicrobium sp.]
MIQLKYPTQQELVNALRRPELDKEDLSGLVSEVFEKVRKLGDRALKEYTEKFDGVRLTDLIVSQEEIDNAEAYLDHELKSAILRAAENIKAFHRSQTEKVVKIETLPGIFCWRKSVPIEKVGLYIPGGTAPLFSTVLMLGIPAKIAGCREIVLCTPAGKDGEINPAILYAASLIGTTRIVKVGGIQAIAAMTLGTESVPEVFKIFGPGNQYVTAAKQFAQQLGKAIDMPAGPSELMVVADKHANPSFVASDLLSQAEHGGDSQVILVTDDVALLSTVQSETNKQLESLERKDIAERSLKYAKLILVEKDQLATIVNAYAPEHLILNTEFNDGLLNEVMNAGSVFIGQYTPESLGDYASGTNHTLPTNGFARMYSGVSLDSFVKKITYQTATSEGLKIIGPVVEKMATAESLTAHRNAVSVRLKYLEENGI